MGYAQVLNTYSVASTTGGTFADNLVANSGDSLTVANYETGGARILEAWAIDSLHIAEGELIYTRPAATHDQQHGMRFNIQSSAFNSVGHVGEVSVLQGGDFINVFKSDTATISVTSTASDCVVYSQVIEYDDLPGASAVFATPATVNNLRKSRVGIACNAVASGTAGAYGATRAINADDDRLHADTWYAIIGVNVQTDVTTIALTGPDWGGQKLGIPAGSIQTSASNYFWDQSLKYGKGLIPCFNSNNRGNTLVQVCDSAVSTSPKIDIQMIELTSYPGSVA
jgi:hypothetical protein